MADLSTKEFALIENLAEHQSQRGLALATGFSLGMTNLLLKRLVKKGYVKVVTLNGRTLRYMLTPVGFAQKVKRSYEFLVASIRQLNEVKERIREVIAAENGVNRRIWVLGQNELAGLAKEVLMDARIDFGTIGNPDDAQEWDAIGPDSVVLVCVPEVLSPEHAGGIKFVELQNLVGARRVQ